MTTGLLGRRLLAATLVLGPLVPPATRHAEAQGTLGGQGYGYPLGQVSARARGAGHAIAELDPTSAVNPAALATWGEPALYFEYLPERRTVSVAGLSDRATTSRFPLVAAALRVGARGTLGLAVSTLLDRTWQTSYDTTVVGQRGPITFTQRLRVTGALNDVRLAGAWEMHPSLRLGLGAHVFSGENRIRADVLGFEEDSAGGSAPEIAVQANTYSYSGPAVSAGFELRPASVLVLAGSARLGGRLRLWNGDTLVRGSDVPMRASGAVMYNGLGGTVVAVRAAWEGWSSMATGTETATVHDTWSIGGGAELRGFRWFGRLFPVRVGVQRRSLPFAAPGTGQVRELGVTGGLGVPLARDRARIDLVAEYDRRDADGTPATESALVIGVGFTVRP